MENEQSNIDQRITNIEKHIEFLVAEAHIARRNRRFVLILTLLFVILPIIILLFALPSIMSQATSMYQL